ncbi:MAG: Trp biosynthesis-associated membrane protein [Actinobacteria bacterium]|nr:Trp biosynthesis-associated membrane protein [Actinomycetota bacterium]MCA1721928.1 Trp biosynthesis-associated membrane protein [Actinomycetota bacterium]
MKRAVLLCAVGAGLLLLACSRAWLRFRLGAVPPLPGRTVTVTGAQLVPAARALGLLGLAGTAALPAARSYGRTAVAAVLAAAGLASAVAVVRVLADPQPAVLRVVSDVGVSDQVDLGPWPYVAVLGATLLVAAGLLTLVRGGTWSALGARYDAPTAPKQESAWDVLDRGDDPTA